jgi:hypothetical protein
MRRFKLFGLMLIAVCAFAVTVVASASATELPLWTTQTAGNATSGAGTLSAEGAKVKCASGTTSFSAGTRLGTFAIHFNSCEEKLEQCRSLGDGNGEILVTGEWHLVALPSDNTHYEVLFLVGTNAEDNSGAVHLECNFSGLILTWGDFLGLIEEISGKTFKINVETEGGNKTIKQTQHEYVNNNGSTITPLGLRVRINGGTERPGGEESAGNLLFMEKTTKLAPS